MKICVKVKALATNGLRIEQIANRAREHGAIKVEMEQSQFIPHSQYVDLIATFITDESAATFMEANVKAGCLSRFGQTKKVFDNVKAGA